MTGPAWAVLVAFVGAYGASIAARADDGSFEALAREAPAVADLGMLLWPFVGDCRHDAGELERARCASVRASLRARLPAMTFSFVRDADAIVASPYDARARAVRLAVTGCLACRQLVDAGAGERRYVTVKAPGRGPSGGPVAAELLRGNVSLASATEAESWAKTVLPYLQVEVLFRPADAPWTVGTSRGYAFAPVGVRVYHRCTGEVLFSQPPSRERAAQESPCAPVADATAASAGEESPEALSPAAINAAMNAARADLKACLDRFPKPIAPRLVFEVASTGEPVSVRAEGAASGTPLGDCLAGVGLQVRFPAFRGEAQRFVYPVMRR